MTETITPKLASAASIAGRTPGRRRISVRGAAGPSASAGCSAASSSAIRFGSGRTARTRPSATRLIAPAASHGTVSASAATSRPANRGPNTAGPRIAPNTDPKSTYEIPRARRSGGYMSPAGGQRGERGRGEEDRGPEPEQPLHARHEHEGQRRDGGHELEDGRVDGHRGRQEQRVAPDDPLAPGRGGHAGDSSTPARW